ncbi:hypothetical protein Cni_G19547 [Canna indica]|uniref:O-methyltransferase C-terminal domain-containing protein n=1 Tax=Canna indica TaxID=4628 RepID=A0AAQ3KKP8_9LILI|nr:hypothetical protein Cni_G19547 [Canna indica]
MKGVSETFMVALLDGYGAVGFGGVETLVDVGGSSGACLRMIMERFPNIQHSVNFDLPLWFQYKKMEERRGSGVSIRDEEESGRGLCKRGLPGALIRCVRLCRHEGEIDLGA